MVRYYLNSFLRPYLLDYSPVLGWLNAAASVSDRAWVIAGHVAPDGLRLAHIIDLGD